MAYQNKALNINKRLKNLRMIQTNFIFFNVLQRSMSILSGCSCITLAKGMSASSYHFFLSKFKFQHPFCKNQSQFSYLALLQLYNNSQQQMLNKDNAKYHQLYQQQQFDFLKYDSFINNQFFEYVYQPNDDTFLMLSTLKQELSTFPNDLFLCEIGSGSGIISAHLNHWLKKINNEPLIHLSIDISMDASQTSSKYYTHYGLNIQQINTAFFNNTVIDEVGFKLKPEIIVFNPPYVPVEQEEIENERKYLKNKLKFVKQTGKNKMQKQQNLIAYSYMGGLDGLAISRKIISLINWTCVFYLIVMEHEGFVTLQQEIKSRAIINKQNELEVKIDLMQYHQFQNEHLYVVRLTFKSNV